MADVTEIEGIEPLGDLRAAWHDLWLRTPRRSFFQSLEWLETYWKYFGSAQRLRTLVVTEDGHPVGIVPLVIKRERTRVGVVRVLTYPLDDWGSFFGPIGPDPGGTLVEAFAYLRSCRPEWESIDLRWIDSDWATPVVQEAMGAAGFASYCTVWDTTAVIDLDVTWDQYLASRSAKWRSSFRRWQRKLQSRHDVQYIRYRPKGERFGQGDPRWDLYEACCQLASRSWQGSSATGTTLSHPGVRDFFREAHLQAARLGTADVNLLLVDGRPAAFAYNYCCGGSVYGVRVGFDPQVSRQGTGSLVCAYSVRDSFQRGDKFYDMGVGSLEGKRHLATRLMPIHRLSYFRPALSRAQLLRLKRWLDRRRLQRWATITAPHPRRQT